MGAAQRRHCFPSNKHRPPKNNVEVEAEKKDVRDEFGKWVPGEITPLERMKNKVHVHFVNWHSNWDLIMDSLTDADRFAPHGTYTKEAKEVCEFKKSDFVLVVRRKPAQSAGRWIQAFVRLVDGMQVQVQYTYKGVTFQYWYHYNQPEIQSLKDSSRWLNLGPSSHMESLLDGVSGDFGTEIMEFLFSRNAKPLKRVGAHADGTCFFHAVFHSLDAKDPNNPKSVSYRSLSTADRRKYGQMWRQKLAGLIDKKWFDENLSNVCNYEQFIKEYKNTYYSTGPTHNLHVASFYKVNIFFVSFYTNPETKAKDFFVRISSSNGAAQYNQEAKSIILFHRALGEKGHYESIQADDEGCEFGQGLFEHRDPVITHLLSKANTLM